MVKETEADMKADKLLVALCEGFAALRIEVAEMRRLMERCAVALEANINGPGEITQDYILSANRAQLVAAAIKLGVPEKLGTSINMDRIEDFRIRGWCIDSLRNEPISL